MIVHIKIIYHWLIQRRLWHLRRIYKHTHRHGNQVLLMRGRINAFLSMTTMTVTFTAIVYKEIPLFHLSSFHLFYFIASSTLIAQLFILSVIISFCMSHRNIFLSFYQFYYTSYLDLFFHSYWPIASMLIEFIHIHLFLHNDHFSP